MINDLAVQYRTSLIHSQNQHKIHNIENDTDDDVYTNANIAHNCLINIALAINVQKTSHK